MTRIAYNRKISIPLAQLEYRYAASLAQTIKLQGRHADALYDEILLKLFCHLHFVYYTLLLALRYLHQVGR